MCLASTRLSDPGGMQGWVDLVGWLHTETVPCGRLSWLMSAFERTLNSISYRIVSVYPPEDGHPSRDTNRQVISIRPIPFNVILTELGLHVCFLFIHKT